MKTNFVNMAFGKVVESKEAGVFKKYIGVAPSFVKAVNPNKEERNKLLNVDIDKEPEYLRVREVDGRQVPQVIVTFYVKPDVEEDVIIPMSFFVSKSYRYNSDKTKVQVIDKYGYSSWATEEEIKSKSQLISSNGNNRMITTEYRPAFDGEIQLIEFIKYYLNIAEALSYINNNFVPNPKIEDKADCECSLNMEKLFKGDFSELKEIPVLMPTNKVKIMYGVRTTDDGKQYQAVYTNKVARNGSLKYKNIEKDLNDKKAYGAYSNVEYDTNPFREYTVEATAFKADTPKLDNPFASAEVNVTPTSSPASTPTSTSTKEDTQAENPFEMPF